MKLESLVLFCSVILMHPLRVYTMAYTPPLVQLRQADFLRQEHDCTPSAPPLSELQPDYADISTQTDLQETSFPFDEQDQEYKKLLDDAQKKNGAECLQALIKAACHNKHTLTLTLLGCNECPSAGTLPLRAAIRGDCLETVKELVSKGVFKTQEAFLFEAIRYGRSDIFEYLSKAENRTYDRSFLEKALTIINQESVIDPTILSYMSLRGLSYTGKLHCDKPITTEKAQRAIEEQSLLYTAIKSNNAAAVAYFIEASNYLFYVESDDFYEEPWYCFEFFLEAAKTDTIRQLLVERKNSSRERAIIKGVEDQKISLQRKQEWKNAQLTNSTPPPSNQKNQGRKKYI